LARPARETVQLSLECFTKPFVIFLFFFVFCFVSISYQSRTNAQTISRTKYSDREWLIHQGFIRSASSSILLFDVSYSFCYFIFYFWQWDFAKSNQSGNDLFCSFSAFQFSQFLIKLLFFHLKFYWKSPRAIMYTPSSKLQPVRPIAI
jgi:hypothetical protein